MGMEESRKQCGPSLGGGRGYARKKGIRQEGQEGQDTPQPSSRPLSTLGDICAIVSTSIIGFLMLLDSSIISTVGPSRTIFTRATLTPWPRRCHHITDDFRSLLDVGWYGSAYQLARCDRVECGRLGEVQG